MEPTYKIGQIVEMVRPYVPTVTGRSYARFGRVERIGQWPDGEYWYWLTLSDGKEFDAEEFEIREFKGKKKSRRKVF